MAHITWSYHDQDQWGGTCKTGKKQSPIDIETQAVKKDMELSPLKFNDWLSNTNGNFNNTGHSVQFDPNKPGQATVQTPLGLYALQQFHMHWGAKSGEGSEHKIDGLASELEIHFVHTKQDQQQAGPNHMVVAVLGKAGPEVDPQPLKDPWRQLDPKDVTGYKSKTPVECFHYSNLLPDNWDYYHYLGSLTTPSCDEDVAWLVLKDKVAVPEMYLDRLRMIYDEHGSYQTHNFRDTQQLNGRVVSTPSDL